MNIDDNNPEIVGANDDLNEFENLFYDRKAPEAEVEDEPVNDEPEDETDEVEEVEGDGEVETPATEDEADEGEEEEDEKPQPKAKKGSFQERINELTAKAREAERERDAVLKRLSDLEAAAAPKKEVKEDVEAARPDFGKDAPDPDAEDDKGEKLYPLGEFDPKFIRDLTRFTIERESERVEAERTERQRQAAIETEMQELASKWQDKLTETEKELPDVREKITVLTDTFQDLDDGYGEYLATTIMACDNGPTILYYLSENLAEARQLVNSGPAAATLAIGRLEALLERETKTQATQPKTKVSEAPEPPKNRSRGSGARTLVKPDTDDLDAFEREFFATKRRY
jgi:hypothetical protein